VLSISEAALVRTVLIHGPLSRAALMERLGFAPASLTRLARPLLEAGILVAESPGGRRPVGRPAQRLDISHELGTVLGVKITSSSVDAVVTDMRASVLRSAVRSLADTRVESVVGQIAEMAHQLDAAGAIGVGVGLGGVVRDGVVIHAPFLDWYGVPLGRMLRDTLKLPVSVENDVITLSEAERWFGLRRGVPGFSVVAVGEGVGHSLVAHGQVVRSPDSGAGLSDHLILDPGGPTCEHHHRGCVSVLLTTTAIARQVSQAVGRALTYEESLELARSGDLRARQVIDRSGRALGRFIALIANVTSQTQFVLAGEGGALFHDAHHQVQLAIAGARGRWTSPLDVQVDDSGYQVWARGAAAVAIQRFVDQLVERGLPGPKG
jgi:predicted NBD/HSP70 family sugar kinase